MCIRANDCSLPHAFASQDAKLRTLAMEYANAKGMLMLVLQHLGSYIAYRAQAQKRRSQEGIPLKGSLGFL